LDVVRSALEICDRFGISYWDSAILAAARASNCDAVYSEDLSADQDYGGPRVINPFAV
jgi:predicted nucleic acid-binding protein